jgi:putative oxidoreductase
MQPIHSASDIVPRLYEWLIFLGDKLRSPLLLLIRLCWGIQFMQTGYGKLTHIDKITGFFSSLGIPFPMANAYLVGFTEMIGGTLLAIGLATRLTSVPLIVTLVVAYVTSEQDALQKLFSFTDIDPFLNATPFLFLLACLVLLAFGPGVFSLDYLIGRWRAREAVAFVPLDIPPDHGE